MRILSPEWLILIPTIFFARWRWPRLRASSPLRLACLLLLLLALLQPEIRRSNRGTDLWVLVDRSASASEGLAGRLTEWEGLLDHSRTGDDRLFLIDYADIAVLRGEGDFAHFNRQLEETRTSLALQLALGRMDDQRNNRILALTDGYSTEPLDRVRKAVISSGIPFDYRLAGADEIVDYRIDTFRAPTRATDSEAFMLEMGVSGPQTGEVPYTILRNGAPVTSGRVRLRHGIGSVRFSDRLEKSGAYKYTAVIQPAQDAHRGNNRSNTWLEVAGSPRILLLSAFRDDPVAALLKERGLTVDLTTDTMRLGIDDLSGTRAVIINNVPASALSQEFLGALEFYVKAQNGGLLMIGGRQSFGSGGYFQSPIDPILPVNMELREEHRKLAVSIALILDRSGSMAASVQGGMGNMTKMNLADEGAARAVDLLGPKDRLAIFAVDSEAHVVVPLTEVSSGKDSISTAARSVTSAGGGIYVYEGLKAGWEELKKVGGQKHIILFSDAADSEEPGDWRNLLAEMHKEKATVSVIGLGSETDSDAQLLKDIAKEGGGRLFFVSNALDLPAVFAQETVSVARSTFVDSPVGLSSTPLWGELASSQLKWPEQIDGYNLNYLKKDASTALFSTDEYKAPLVAFWQRGTGRVGAVSFPLSGDFSRSVRSWPAYPGFVESLARWIMGPETPPGLGVKTALKGNTLEIHLFYSEDWQKDFALNPPSIAIASSVRKELPAPVWQHLTPGHFQSSLTLEPGELIRGSVLMKNFSLPFGPLGAQVSPEWSFDRERLEELKDLSASSGGVERLDLASIWSAPGRVERYNLRPWILTLLLLTFLSECLLSRLNYQMSWPALSFPKIIRPRWPAMPKLMPAMRKRPKSQPAPLEPDTGAEDTARIVSPAQEKPASRLKDSLSRAKRGGK